MTEVLNKVANAFRKPFEKVNDDVYVVHDDYREQKFDKPINYMPEIARHVINQSIVNKCDFIEFVNEFKTNATKIFYDNNSVRAVFNYSTPYAADYGDSVCRMSLVTTDEYNKFTSCVNGSMNQRSFVQMLKQLEPYIVAFDNKKTDEMDIIEIAESLTAAKKIDSVERNNQRSFNVSIEVRSGKADVAIPRYITFELPVYKNDRMEKAVFITELFLAGGDNGFDVELKCYNQDTVIEETVKKITGAVIQGCDGVNAFYV